MKQPASLLLLMALLAAHSAAVAQDAPPDEPPPPVESDLGIGDTSVGDQFDIGTPAPIDGLGAPAENSQPPPPEVPGMPAFENVPDAPKNAEETPKSEEVPPPAVEKPAPAAPAERVADDPDFRRERNFHRVYKKYNEQPTPAQAWEQAAGSQASQVYKVQKGDTLWDLSKTLFADTNYWPKIWALNHDEIYNPHEIDTWMNIRFFPGDLNEAPKVIVDEAPKLAANETAPSGDGLTAPADAVVSDASLIPPAKKRTPVVKNLPGSLPLYRYERVNVPPPSLEGVRPPVPPARPNATLAYYASEKGVEGVGVVKETELGGPTASEYQYIYVSLPAGTSDRRFAVVKDVGEIKDPSTGALARLIEVQGEIEIIDSASDQENLYRAIVKKSIAPLEVGSSLRPGPLKTVSTQDGEPVAGPSLQVVASQFNSDRHMTDAEGFIFLNGGERAGVHEGQILPIYANRSLRAPNSAVRLGGRLIGHVRVVRTTPNFATGFLTQVTDDIQIGDLVGSSKNEAAALPAPPTGPSMEDSGATATDSELSAELDSADGEAAPEMKAAPDESGGGEAPSSGDDELSLDDPEF